jgi:Endonuclease-reverse transcriptase
MMSNNQNLSRQFLPLGPSLKICQLNIEGISISKCEYLARLMREEDIDIIAVQETHTASEESLRRRGSIQGYTLIDAIYSNVHGIATYVKTALSDCRVVFKNHSAGVHTLAIEVDGTVIVNVYKPPSACWPNNMLKLFPHPAIYVGDFNSHNQQWGYDHNDADGSLLSNWMTLNKLHLIYHPKDKGTFRSARWRKDCTPDLAMVTLASASDDILCTRDIVDSFPRSQHRPVILHYGLRLPLTESIPKSRWNFLAAGKRSRKTLIMLYNSYQLVQTPTNDLHVLSRQLQKDMYHVVFAHSIYQAGSKIAKICTKNTRPITTELLLIVCWNS